ncbi:SNase-domain-containing protein [Terfezia boudieri ATCC MYA-4762]|uniref:Probable endonuclease LCL3 n=1 Tax=Terfezia boudieri ATCC MYA-4762 TaxID=1051890 RepID=A0A3N4LW81_9PEZI|nr:SNase-domain-containing protein [Terfezia boudieri ATCC MYA-4762]
MRWPWYSDDDSRRKPLPPLLSIEYWSDPKNYLHPRVLVPASVLAACSLGLIYVYRAYVRRIPESSQIYPSFFRKRSLFGKVTSVGDGDNFRLYHTPGGRLLGWGWFPGRKVPTDPKELRQRTVHIRIAGIDAPELGHWGNPAQPYSAESLEWLRTYILGKRVRAYIYRRDQYERIVCSAKVWKGLWRRDLGLEMLKAGVAAVYEAKTGAEFGDMELKYRVAEATAKIQKKGMWGLKGQYESPGTYKKALKEAEAAASSSGHGGASSSAPAASKSSAPAASKSSAPAASKSSAPAASKSSAPGPSKSSAPGPSKGSAPGASKTNTGKPSSAGTPQTGVKGGVVVVGKPSSGKRSTTRKMPPTSATTTRTTARKKAL